MKDKEGRKQDYCDEAKKVSNLALDVYQREKITMLLKIQPFEINDDNLISLQDYWYEDIEMLERLHDDGNLQYVHFFDGVGTCVEMNKNVGVEIEEGSICDVDGFCEVSI